MKKQFKPVDFSDTSALAADAWLFLTSSKMPTKATISKKTFLFEVKALLDTVREHARDQILSSLSVMNSEQFQKFLEVRKVSLTLDLVEIGEELQKAKKLLNIQSSTGDNITFQSPAMTKQQRDENIKAFGKARKSKP